MAKMEKKIQTLGRLHLVPLKLFEHANVTVRALTRLLNFTWNGDHVHSGCLFHAGHGVCVWRVFSVKI